MILVIDNYDSFTYNLVQYLGELAADFPVANDLQVVRNDQITVDEIRKLNPDAVVISPGPGRPEEAGVSLDIIQEMGANTPILGVCLGHQPCGRAVRARTRRDGLRPDEPGEGVAASTHPRNHRDAARPHLHIARRIRAYGPRRLSLHDGDGTSLRAATRGKAGDSGGQRAGILLGGERSALLK